MTQRLPWLGLLIVCGRTLLLGVGPRGTAWAESLVLLAAFVIVPWGLELLLTADASLVPPARAILQLNQQCAFPAAVLLLVAFIPEIGPLSALLTVPWLLVTLLCGLAAGVQIFIRRTNISICEIPFLAALLFLPLGGGWLLLARAGIRPLEFPAPIVLLTALHFHYAGWALPILAGLCAIKAGPKFPHFGALAAVVGVPLVALGITLSQLGASPGWEMLAGTWLSLTGLLLASQQWQLVVYLPTAPTIARWLWRVSSLSLALGMLLSLGYALRSLLPSPVLDITFMRATHGTLNALGFSLCGLLAWRLKLKAVNLRGKPA